MNRQNKTASVRSDGERNTNAKIVDIQNNPSINNPVLSVIIPVYNEASTIDQLLENVVAAPFVKQIVVIDDGSSDGSLKILEKWAQHPQIELLRHSENRGKGAAIRTGLEHAKGQFVIVQDADLEYDPRDYPLLIEPLMCGEADVVYGSRYLSNQTQSAPWSMFRLGVMLLNLVVRLIYGAKLSDEATCYKAFSTSLLRAMDLECERFEFCPEVTAKACLMELTILEVPISYHPRSRDAGKKIRIRDGVEALATLWKWRHWQPNTVKARSLDTSVPCQRSDPMESI